VTKLLIPFLLASGISQAAYITSGSIDLVVGHPTFGTVTLNMPGFQLNDGLDSFSFTPGISIPVCTLGPCSANFTGTVSGNYAGGNFRGFQGRLFYSLQIVGTPLTANPVCQSCGPGIPPTYLTAWPGGTFTMTGTIWVLDEFTMQTLVSESIAGGGFTSADSAYYAALREADYQRTTYTFATPEPSTGGLLLVAAAGLAAMYRKARA
jgi:hypothetical protein